MSSIQTRRRALPPQVSATLRFATAVAVAALLALAWIGAEHASHQAVQTATAAMWLDAGTAKQLAVAVAARREAAAARRI